jgi:transcriptional repressor NrdR
MICPFCGNEDTQVKDSRPAEDGAAIRRRRLCGQCEARFTTFERVQLREITIVKRNGRRSIFDRDKLERSFEIALRKRDVDTDDVARAYVRYASVYRNFREAKDFEAFVEKELGE